MKKLLLVILMIFYTAEAGADDNILEDVAQQTQIHTSYCYHLFYSEDEANPIYGLTNDNLKYANQNYHQCIKKIIIKYINKTATPQKAEQMIEALNKIEKGILELYWDIYNREDLGFVGRLQNDAYLGRVYEKILEDIIFYDLTSSK